jgi:hypothetical protein
LDAWEADAGGIKTPQRWIIVIPNFGQFHKKPLCERAYTN